MAGKKGRVQNSDFLKQLTANTGSTAKNVTDTLRDLGEQANEIETGKKKLKYIDVSSIDNAPDDWNLYPRLKDTQKDKYLELKFSIFEKGVEEPCVVWEQENGRHMMLSGHNRKDISMELIEEYSEDPVFDENKYRYLPCIVYSKTELDETQAKNIINDTNLYRDFSKLPRRIKTEIIRVRMNSYKTRRYAKGERIEQLAKDFGVEKSALYEELAIEKIYPPLRELYYFGTLTRKTVLKFNYYAMDTQEWIHQNYAEKITEAKVKLLKKSMGREDISMLFESAMEVTKKITVDVPIGKVDAFKEMFAEWLETQKKQD